MTDTPFDPIAALHELGEGIPAPQPIELPLPADKNHPAAKAAAEAGFKVVTTQDDLRDYMIGEGLPADRVDYALGRTEVLPMQTGKPLDFEYDTGHVISDLKPAEVVNPKEIAGSKKPAIWSVMPRWVALAVGRVMSVGAAKYGKFNYRESAITASTYEDAIERHASLWFDGEDNDPETGVSHLASVIASCLLLMDAQRTGKLSDDRQKTGIVRQQLDELERLLVDLPLPQRKA